MGKHALLSASSSHRWLACPPSARLCADKEDKGSEYAQQGTDAHSLCEHKLKEALGLETTDPTEHLDYYDSEMEDCATEYASYVMELVELVKQICKDPVVLMAMPEPAKAEPPEKPAFVAAMAIKKPTTEPATSPVLKPQPTVTATPPPQCVDYSHVRPGTTVRHKAFGKGLVKEIKDGRVSVAFDAVEKVFLFPAAFLQGFLYPET